ncbi:MAG: DUF1573 domain-containing protein [Prevotellaceae bacterium]|jgi:hypothetical protein|nr:DUF1573 domain-containing protein [Prevotellaceae bacterium]
MIYYQININKKHTTAKIIILCIACLFTTTIFSQKKAVISFNETIYDFGTIKEEDGDVSHTFEFTNTGDTTLRISNVRCSASNMTPYWNKQSVAPGEKGSVTIKFRPYGREGFFYKASGVESNAANDQVLLFIKGNILPAKEYFTVLFRKSDVGWRDSTLNQWLELGNDTVSFTKAIKGDCCGGVPSFPEFSIALQKELKKNAKYFSKYLQNKEKLFNFVAIFLYGVQKPLKTR